MAEWCVARCIRALGRPSEALALQERLAAETTSAGEPESGFEVEEIGECPCTKSAWIELPGEQPDPALDATTIPASAHAAGS